MSTKTQREKDLQTLRLSGNTSSEPESFTDGAEFARLQLAKQLSKIRRAYLLEGGDVDAMVDGLGELIERLESLQECS